MRGKAFSRLLRAFFQHLHISRPVNRILPSNRYSCEEPILLSVRIAVSTFPTVGTLLSLGFGQSHWIQLRIGQDRPTQQVLLSRCLVSTIVRGFALEDVGPKSPESGFSTESNRITRNLPKPFLRSVCISCSGTELLFLQSPYLQRQLL